MKVLVIGQGGREHALVWKLAQSPEVTKVFCAPGNAGTDKDGENVPIADNDIPALLEFAQKEKIDLTIPGPEVPLVMGIVDEFKKAGLKVFGPTKAAAQLEGSKTFAKEVMTRAKVPTGDYESFEDLEAAEFYLKERYGGGFQPEGPIGIEDEEAWFRQPKSGRSPVMNQPIVVKADGLAAGKGVKVCATYQEALDFVRDCLAGNAFGEAGARVIIEDFLEGAEASILAIVDGKTIIPLEASQDHKAAHDGDTGPNTGGMGAYCPTPVVDTEMMDEITKTVLIPIVHEMKRRGCNFSGVLYAGLMIDKQGNPKVLEFNVRFGDPETQPVLMRLKSDLFKLLDAAASGTLRDFEDIEWDPRPAVCVVMASRGYPGSYKKGYPIRGLGAVPNTPELKVFHAGTKIEGGEIVNSGGRVLGVTAMGNDLNEAKLNAYARVKTIRWEGAWCRKDISDKARPEIESPASEIDTEEIS